MIWCEILRQLLSLRWWDKRDMRGMLKYIEMNVWSLQIEVKVDCVFTRPDPPNLQLPDVCPNQTVLSAFIQAEYK